MMTQTNDKPRICEVLGVEVGERFNIVGCSDFDACEYNANQRFFIDSTETLLEEMVRGKDSPAAISDCRALCLAIKEPDRIIRQPRFTDDEVADAKAIMRILGATKIERTEYGGNLCAVVGNIASIVINRDMFPSIRPGMAVEIGKIIGESE